MNNIIHIYNGKHKNKHYTVFLIPHDYMEDATYYNDILHYVMNQSPKSKIQYNYDVQSQFHYYVIVNDNENKLEKRITDELIDYCNDAHGPILEYH